jgi:hypothetical protein
MKFTGRNIRHGDLCLCSVDALPEGLKASDTNVLMTGSGGNDHVFGKGTFYPHVDGQIVGYLVAEGTKLLHPDHGKKGKGTLRKVNIANGIYEARRQNEETHEALRPVVD